MSRRLVLLTARHLRLQADLLRLRRANVDAALGWARGGAAEAGDQERLVASLRNQDGPRLAADTAQAVEAVGEHPLAECCRALCAQSVVLAGETHDCSRRLARALAAAVAAIAQRAREAEVARRATMRYRVRADGQRRRLDRPA